MIRTSTVILSILMTVMLLGCGLSSGGQKAGESDHGVSGSESPLGAPAPATPPVEPPSVASLSVTYDGPTALEERIFKSPVIARVRLNSVTSTVESATIFDGSTKYIALLEFSFSVLEYLKGSGASDIVAIWESRPIFDTRREAEAALPAVVAARDVQWDGHDAIVFLQTSLTYLTSTQQAGRYYLSWQDEIDVLDDGYSITTRHDKLWLPAEAAVGTPSQPTGDQQRFLMDAPPATGTAPTITLGEMKTRIAAVTAKLNAGDGSEEYRECVQSTYSVTRAEKATTSIPRRRRWRVARKTPDHELDSGLAASSVVYEESPFFGIFPDKKGRTWLDGADADLFSVESGDAVPWDSSGDGVNNLIYFARFVVSSRPLPAGVYRFHFNDVWAAFVRCDGWTIRYEWTVTVTAPEGTLHEAFFDPVTDGSVVAADSTNGVLNPAEFTDANGRRRPLSGSRGKRVPESPGR